MSDELKFVQKLQECVKEWRQKSIQTRDDSDTAHYFNAGLKKFLKDHKEEMNILSTMTFERAFMIWMKTYLLSEKKED